jgi:hypothetical protein
MFKYYALLFSVFVIAVGYVYLRDPCNRQVREDFSNRHPSYRIVESGASEGSPESVRCHVSYQKPGSGQIYEDIWLYQYVDTWKFLRVIRTGSGEGVDEDRVGEDRIPDRDV